jgi:hypothetical protein
MCVRTGPGSVDGMRPQTAPHHGTDTSTSTSTSTGTAPAERVIGPALRLARALAVLGCLPYLGLKLVWIAGGDLGIPAHSVLLDHHGVAVAVNALTAAMDAAVVVLALLLTRPWGLRVRAWLLVLPVWAATGLLAPIMIGFPAQLLVHAFGGSVIGSGGESEAFLDPWVFDVVYGGFIVQGLALGVLFTAYARYRWGGSWRGRVQDLPARPVPGPARQAAVIGALVALLPAALHTGWACGSTVGLTAERVASRTDDFRVLEGMHALFAVAVAAGLLMLAFRRGGPLPLRVPLALAWVGSGALACWGGWLTLARVTGVEDLAERPTGLLQLTYAGQMILGVLTLALGARFFAGRAVDRRTE